MTFRRICPSDIYNTGPDKDGVCEIKNFRVAMAAGAGVTTIIAAVTSKKIRILTLNVITDTATTGFNLQSNGTLSFDAVAVFNANNYWSEPEVGITESLVSQPIQAQIAAGSAFTFSGRYLEFTP